MRHLFLQATRKTLPMATLFAVGFVAEESRAATFDIDRIGKWVPALMKEFHVPGVSIAVVSSNRVSWTGTWGVKRAGDEEAIDEETLFEACSMSKPLFAYAALKLVEDGRLDLDRPLTEYLDKPYLDDQPDHRLITARMVLTHTTGFPNWRKGGWRKGGPLPLKFKPGSEYGYSGEGFLYLQRVVERIVGEELDPFMRRSLMRKIGMETSGYEFEQSLRSCHAGGHDLQGRLKTDRRFFDAGNAAFSLYTTPVEYARFMIEIMREDRTAAHSLSRKSLDEMLKPAVEATGRHDGWRGLGWQLHQTPGGQRVSHGGSNGTGFRCHCRFYPGRREGIVIMTNSYGGEKLWKQLIQEIDPG